MMKTSRRNFLRLGLAGAGVALAGTTATAFAGTRVTATSRWVTLEGAYNVRDLGGLTAGRCTVRPGLAYRSAALNGLTDAGVAQLSTLGVVCVVDSRGAQERADRGEDRLPVGVDLVHAEIPNGTFTPTPDLPAPDPAVLAVFRGFVTDARARTGTATVLHRAATGDMPLVMHDSSGTYRTGWVSAVLLAALGVDMAQIVDDFVLSDEALGAKFAFPEYLHAGFDQARTTYGSFSNFLIGGLGMGGNVLPSLRRRLLG